MSAQLQELPLFHVDFLIGGKPQRMASNVNLAVARQVRGFERAVRMYRADREKPLPLKLAHSIRPSRATGEPMSRWSIRDKAKAMAEHIKRTGQTELPLFYTGREAWPGGVPSSVREFNEALLQELGAQWDMRGRKELRLPEPYRVVYVDPSKDVQSHDG